MNKNIKKIIFLISLLPYILFLILGIINTTNYCIKYNHIDLYQLIAPLSDFWFEGTTSFNIPIIILSAFCIIYPIYFIIDYLINKNKKRDNRNLKINKLFKFYLITFLPYIYLILKSFLGVKTGLFTNHGTSYGFDAIMLVLIVGTFIPIYPAVLIFQIIYTILNRNKFTLKEKKIIKWLILSIVLLLIFSILIFYFL